METAIGNGARVLAVARQEAPLRQLAQEVPALKYCRSMQQMKAHPPKYSTSSSPISWFYARARFRLPANTPAELAGVRRQLGDGRQNRISLLEGGVVAASARGLLGDSDLERRRSRRIADLGKYAVAGYSRYFGISAADFIQSMPSPPAPSDVANAVIELVTTPDRSKGTVFIVSGKGLEVVPS